MNEDTKQEQSPLPPEEKKPAPTPAYIRVLALLGALAMVGLTIAYTYSLATGGIFWF